MAEHIAVFSPQMSTGKLPLTPDPVARVKFRTMTARNKYAPQDPELAVRIRRRLDELGLTANAASEMAGHRDILRNYFAGRQKSFRGDTLVALARVLQVSVGWFYSAKTEKPGSPVTLTVPLHSWVSAGLLMSDDGPQEPLADVTAADLDPRGKWVALQVQGDSMDRISPPASIILVNMNDCDLVPNGCYVIKNSRHDATYKRWRPNPSRFEPVSTNLDHTPVIPDGEITVIGRVRRTMLDL
jgi:SOS-response transcriptional repressor LexA